MNMAKYVMALDAGTTSNRCILFDEKGKMCSVAQKEFTQYYPQPGWVQMNIDEFLNITVECMKKTVDAIKGKGYSPSDIAAVMGDGIICGICGVDKNGKAVTPYINYLDSRTQADVDAINAKNLDIWGRETGNPEANCMFPAMFARWFLANSEDFRQKGVKFVHIDWGAMSGWGLGYKVEKKEWSDEQLDILGIDKKYMPRILKPWDIVGGVSEEMAARTGLVAGTPVCAGAGDTMQSMLGSGVFEAGQGVDVAGTCAMFCVSTKGIVPELSKKGSGLIFNSGTLENTYFYWGFIRTGGLSLRWFKDNICQKAVDSSYYRILSEKAEEVPAGSNGVVFLPYLTGGTGEFKGASGMFLNMTLDDDQFVQWRAVLEAIGYDYMEITDTYRAAGVDLNRITVTEGGSRDSLWNQIKADMLNATVVRYRNAGGAVVTNCVFAAKAAGHIDDVRPLLEKTIIKDAEYTPNADNSTLYRKLFDLKTKLVKADLQPSYATLMQMRETKVKK